MPLTYYVDELLVRDVRVPIARALHVKHVRHVRVGERPEVGVVQELP